MRRAVELTALVTPPPKASWLRRYSSRTARVGPSPQSVWVLGLLVITLGIYQIVWWYFVNREMRDYGQATGQDLGRKPTNSALAVFSRGASSSCPSSSPTGGDPAGAGDPARRRRPATERMDRA